MSERLPRFRPSQRPDLRGVPRWNRLAYIVGRLQRDLERLAGELRLAPAARLLDYGCAEAPYRSFFGPGIEYVGADLPGNPVAAIDLNPDGTLPLPDASFDAVLSTQVLEHVLDPALYLDECFRVLKPGGRMLLSTHGLMVWHPDPVDHWRWTCSGLQLSVRRAGFDVVHFEGIMGLAATGLQLLQESVQFRLPRRAAQALAFVLQSLMALVDRLERQPSKDMNALVFALVAEKPASA